MRTKEFMDFIRATLDSDRKVLDTIRKGIAALPEGTLTVAKRKNGGIEYRHITYSGGKRHQKYIGKDNIDLVRKLAQKPYLAQVKAQLESEISILETVSNNLNLNRKYEIFDELSKEKQDLVTSVYITPAEKVREWRDSPYIRNTAYPEDLIHETKKGELRRSKSEVDISDELDEYSDVLEYRYEPGLYLEKSKKCVNPDFEIINLKTGRKYYWEHYGGFGQEKYDKDYVSKMLAYSKESKEFLESFIQTYETKGIPLQYKTIKEKIERMVRSE